MLALSFTNQFCWLFPPNHHLPACMLSCFSHVWLFVTPWTAATQAPLSMRFSRQEYWSGSPCPSPGIFLTQRLNLHLLHCRQILYCWITWEAQITILGVIIDYFHLIIDSFFPLNFNIFYSVLFNSLFTFNTKII